MGESRATTPLQPALELARWTISSGSNVQSRGAVVIGSGDHQWEGSAEGNGPVDALYRAVDRALHDVLTGQPRLLAYDVHALAEGPAAEAVVRVAVGPPSSAVGHRASGRYEGEARSTNIIAASVEAYIQALNRLLAELHWADATELAGNRKRARDTAETDARARLDEDEASDDPISWYERWG